MIRRSVVLALGVPLSVSANIQVLLLCVGQARVSLAVLNVHSRQVLTLRTSDNFLYDIVSTLKFGWRNSPVTAPWTNGIKITGSTNNSVFVRTVEPQEAEYNTSRILTLNSADNIYRYELDANAGNQSTYVWTTDVSGAVNFRDKKLVYLVGKLFRYSSGHRYSLQFMTLRRVSL